MKIPENFCTEVYWSKMFSWVHSAFQSFGFPKGVYDDDLHALAEQIVQDTYETVLRKPNDYPLKLSEKRAHEDAEEMAERYVLMIAGQNTADQSEKCDGQYREKYLEFYQQRLAERVKDTESDDWWPPHLRQTLNNHVRQEIRNVYKPRDNNWTRVTIGQVQEDFDEPSLSSLGQEAFVPPIALDSLLREEMWQCIEERCRQVSRGYRPNDDDVESAFVEVVRRYFSEGETINEAHRIACPNGRPISRAATHRWFGQLLHELYLSSQAEQDAAEGRRRASR